MPIKTITNNCPKDCVVWKYPDKNITFGSQIIVNETEEAHLFENGQLLSTLKSGRHTVESGNIPGLEGLLQKSFNGKNPIFVEVWFFKKIAIFDYKWGAQIPVIDSETRLSIPLGARGNYSLRIKDPMSFLFQMVGTETSFKHEQIKENLLDNVTRNLKDYIAEEVTKRGSDPFTLSAELKEISTGVKNSLINEIARFGLELIDFFVVGIDVINENPEVKRIMELRGFRAEGAAVRDTGDFYKLQRSFDAVEKAAENEGGLAGTFLSGGLGLGLGLNTGQQMGQTISQATNINNNNNEQTQSGADITAKLKQLKELLESGLITQEDYESKKSKLIDLL